jgi:hypothetical protein
VKNYWEQREKVQKEFIKLQVLVDAELEDSTFIWNPESKFVQITFDIFRKEKKTREKDEEEDIKEEPKHSIVFKVEGSQSFHCLYLVQNSPRSVGGRKPLNLCYGCRKIRRHHSHRRWNKVLLLFR